MKSHSTFTSFIRWSLFLTNLILLAFSIGIMVISVAGIVKSRGIDALLSTPSNMTIAALSFNALAIVLSFIGCLGACKENKLLLYIYTVICGSLSAIHLVLSVVFFVYSNHITESVSRKLEQSLKNKGKMEFRSEWDTIQTTFQCCGFNNFTDWNKYDSNHSDDIFRGVPASCCPSSKPNSSEATICTFETTFDQTCGLVVKEAFKVLTNGLGGFTLFLFIVWFLAACFALSVARATKIHMF